MNCVFYLIFIRSFCVTPMCVYIIKCTSQPVRRDLQKYYDRFIHKYILALDNLYIDICHPIDIYIYIICTSILNERLTVFYFITFSIYVYKLDTDLARLTQPYIRNNTILLCEHYVQISIKKKKKLLLCTRPCFYEVVIIDAHHFKTRRWQPTKRALTPQICGRIKIAF